MSKRPAESILEEPQYKVARQSLHTTRKNPHRVYAPQQRYANHPKSGIGDNFHSLSYPLTLLPFSSWQKLHQLDAPKTGYVCPSCLKDRGEPSPHKHKLFLVAERLCWAWSKASAQEKEQNQMLLWQINYQLGILDPYVETATPVPGGRESRSNEWYPFESELELEAVMKLIERADKLTEGSMHMWRSMLSTMICGDNDRTEVRATRPALAEVDGNMQRKSPNEHDAHIDKTMSSEAPTGKTVIADDSSSLPTGNKKPDVRDFTKKYNQLVDLYAILDRVERTSFVSARFLEAYAESLRDDLCGDCWIKHCTAEDSGADRRPTGSYTPSVTAYFSSSQAPRKTDHDLAPSASQQPTAASLQSRPRPEYPSWVAHSHPHSTSTPPFRDGYVSPYSRQSTSTQRPPETTTGTQPPGAASQARSSTRDMPSIPSVPSQEQSLVPHQQWAAQQECDARAYKFSSGNPMPKLGNDGRGMGGALYIPAADTRQRRPLLMPGNLAHSEGLEDSTRVRPGTKTKADSSDGPAANVIDLVEDEDRHHAQRKGIMRNAQVLAQAARDAAKISVSSLLTTEPEAEAPAPILPPKKQKLAMSRSQVSPIGIPDGPNTSGIALSAGTGSGLCKSGRDRVLRGHEIKHLYPDWSEEVCEKYIESLQERAKRDDAGQMLYDSLYQRADSIAPIGPTCRAKTPSSRPSTARKFYGVRGGVAPGVYETWDEVVHKAKYGLFRKSFAIRQEAEAFVAEPALSNVLHSISQAQKQQPPCAMGNVPPPQPEPPKVHLRPLAPALAGASGQQPPSTSRPNTTAFRPRSAERPTELDAMTMSNPRVYAHLQALATDAIGALNQRADTEPFSPLLADAVALKAVKDPNLYAWLQRIARAKDNPQDLCNIPLESVKRAMQFNTVKLTLRELRLTQCREDARKREHTTDKGSDNASNHNPRAPNDIVAARTLDVQTSHAQELLSGNEESKIAGAKTVNERLPPSGSETRVTVLQSASRDPRNNDHLSAVQDVAERGIPAESRLARTAGVPGPSSTSHASLPAGDSTVSHADKHKAPATPTTPANGQSGSERSTLPSGEPNCLARLTFFFIGTYDDPPRQTLEALIKEYGGRVQNAPRVSTSWIVKGQPRDTDAEKRYLADIRRNGTRSIDVRGLFDIIRTRKRRPVKDNGIRAAVEYDLEQERDKAKTALSPLAIGDDQNLSPPGVASAASRPLSAAGQKAQEAAKEKNGQIRVGGIVNARKLELPEVQHDDADCTTEDESDSDTDDGRKGMSLKELGEKMTRMMEARAVRSAAAKSNKEVVGDAEKSLPKSSSKAPTLMAKSRERCPTFEERYEMYAAERKQAATPRLFATTKPNSSVPPPSSAPKPSKNVATGAHAEAGVQRLRALWDKTNPGVPPPMHILKSLAGVGPSTQPARSASAHPQTSSTQPARAASSKPSAPPPSSTSPETRPPPSSQSLAEHDKTPLTKLNAASIASLSKLSPSSTPVASQGSLPTPPSST